MPVYIVDIGCYKPPDELRVNMDDIDKTDMYRKVRHACFTPIHIEMQLHSGVGTYSAT